MGSEVLLNYEISEKSIWGNQNLEKKLQLKWSVACMLVPTCFTCYATGLICRKNMISSFFGVQHFMSKRFCPSENELYGNKSVSTVNK